MADYTFSSSLWGLILKWKKELGILAVVAMVLSIGFSFTIDPLFKSYAVLYPANIIPMGTETPTEQMLQVLESDQIRDSVVNRYDLTTIYGINKDAKGGRSALIREYQSMVTTRKTEYESVVVEVLDTDPVRSRDMVNSIIHFFNGKEKLMQKEKSMELVVILNQQLSEKVHEMDSMESRLTGLRKEYGILDYDLQTEYATERYLDVLTTPSKRSSAKEIEPLLTALKERGGEFKSLNEHLWRTRGSYNDLKEQLEQAKRDVDKQLTFCNVITHPEVTDKKAYPVRWLIVLTSVLATLLVAIVTIVLMESSRTIVASDRK